MAGMHHSEQGLCFFPQQRRLYFLKYNFPCSGMRVLIIFLITETLQIKLETIPFSDWMTMLAAWFPSRGWWPWSILEFWRLQCQQAFFVNDFCLSSAFTSSPVPVLFSVQGYPNTDAPLICNFYLLPIKNIKQSESKTGRDLKGE